MTMEVVEHLARLVPRSSYTNDWHAEAKRPCTRPEFLLAPPHSGRADSESEVEDDYFSVTELSHRAEPGHEDCTLAWHGAGVGATTDAGEAAKASVSDGVGHLSPEVLVRGKVTFR
eukprot:jgi/Tetstr1/431649/TSEL_021178.t1